MSNSEEYLDGLLQESISGKKREPGPMQPMPETPQAEAIQPAEEPMPADGHTVLETGGRESEDAFLHAFEEELLGGEDTDAFVRQFEQELAEDEKAEIQKQPAGDELLFENLDGILNEAREEADDDVMVDTIGDLSEFSVDMSGDGEAEEPGRMALQDSDGELPDAEFDMPVPELDGLDDGGDLLEESSAIDEFTVSEDNQTDDEDADVQMDDDLMNLLQSEGEFSEDDEVGNIDDLMPTEAELQGITPDDGDFGGMDDFGLDVMMGDETGPEAEPVEETPKEKKPGLLKRLSLLLFGPDEDEAAAVSKKESNIQVIPADIEDLTDENLALLQSLEGVGQTEPETPAEPEVDEKALKKQQKKEKKEQKKKEKAEKKEQKKKEKANKPKKEKKPKKPKEPDNTPPLPKVPVFLCFVMAASILALVIIGTNLFSYSNSLTEAQRSFDQGDYESAFAHISGMELKEADMEFYEKCRILANASAEYNAYQSFFAYDYYDLALDSLIRAIGRCDKYAADAELYGCGSQLASVRMQAVGALSGFGVSEEQALALYANDDRAAYSMEIYGILAAAGFEQSGEE